MAEFYYGFGVLSVEMEPDNGYIVPDMASGVVAWALVA